MLNNQPMGFYNPATLVKDAQRHGLRVRPIDITRSDWLCTLEKNGADLFMRVGLRYVKGLREQTGREIVHQRTIKMFYSIDDLKLRVPALQKSELTALAEIGALNFLGNKSGFHRRDALWQIERVARRPGPLLESCEEESEAPEDISSANASHSPLPQMTAEDRLVADFRNTGMTVGPHPLAYHRSQLKKEGILSAADLHHVRDGVQVRVAGSVIARQRPGTAKGFVFLSLEDETGISNAIITPQIFRQDHVVIVNQQFLLIEGRLQNQDNVISVKAERIRPLFLTRAQTTSHDFH
jgi:error-prone DNA polymerase